MVIDYGKRGFSAREWVRTLLLVVGLLAASGVAVFVGTCVLFAVAMRPPRVDLLDFNSERWKAASNTDASFNSVRLRMAHSFLAGQRPVGKTRAEIVALLGEPDRTPYFRGYDMVYYLGPERSAMPIDSEWLVLKLKDGVVTEVRLARD
jgi:hypothetical protein